MSELSLDQQIGLRIKELRIVRGISQKDVSEQLGVSYQQLQKYEKGNNRISVNMLLQILRIFDASIEEFFAPLETAPSEDNAGVQSYRLFVYYHRISEPETKAKIYDLIKAIATREEL